MLGAARPAWLGRVRSYSTAGTSCDCLRPPLYHRVFCQRKRESGGAHGGAVSRRATDDGGATALRARARDRVGAVDLGPGPAGDARNHATRHDRSGVAWSVPRAAEGMRRVAGRAIGVRASGTRSGTTGGVTECLVVLPSGARCHRVRAQVTRPQAFETGRFNRSRTCPVTAGQQNTATDAQTHRRRTARATR
jgi:hypothetical protein